MNREKNILLTGYYNAGNIGDDLLMISSYKILKTILPNYQIYIYTGRREPYISTLLPEARAYNPEENNYDFIVYGGGGLFFDFKESGNIILNNSATKKLSMFLFRNIIRKDRRKIGLSVGIGPYNAYSKQFYKDMYALAHFGFLSVRDKMSFRLAKKVNSDALLHSDLVFNPDLNQLFNAHKPVKKYDVGIIFRDWRYGRNELSKLIELSEYLKKHNKKTAFFSFNPANDSLGIEMLRKNNINPFLYNPNELDGFIRHLSETNFIISQRAHGMILANLLKIPVIGLELEPKLRNVHKMIPNTSKILSLKEINKIPEILNRWTVLPDDFAKDHLRNVKLIKELKKDLNNYINEKN